MTVLRREWYGVTRTDTFTLIPLGDVHLGNAACNEKLFRSVVQRIADDPRAFWVGMGDFCEFINRSDPRFDVDSLATWIKMRHIGDLARAQRDRFLDIVRPIAGKCLALVEGNHERAVAKYYERNIYSDIVTGVKEMGGFEPDYNLALGYCGWMVLSARSEQPGETHRAGSLLKMYLHHGFVGGRLAGAKALNMQRFLWRLEADLIIFGHSHNTAVQVEAVEGVAGSRVVETHRIGCYAGTFMSGANYAREAGYLPLPLGHLEIQLKPRAKHRKDRIKVTAGG